MTFSQDEVFGFGSTCIHQIIAWFFFITYSLHYYFHYDLESDKTPWPVWISVRMEEIAHINKKMTYMHVQNITYQKSWNIKSLLIEEFCGNEVF